MANTPLESAKESLDAQSKIPRNYFKDISSYNFKYGLQLGKNNPSFQDEDPVIYGFELVIHNNDGNGRFTSPLIDGSSVTNFLAFADKQGIKEVSSRASIYTEFISKLKLFFNDSTGDFKSFKSHYIKSVKGLDNLIHNASGITDDNHQFVNYGKDKLTFSMYEDLNLNSGYLAFLYKTLCYSKINGKMIIPENLLRFDMSIIISEVRNFNLVRGVLNNNKNTGAGVDEKAIGDANGLVNDGVKYLNEGSLDFINSSKTATNKNQYVAPPTYPNPNERELFSAINVFKDNISRYVYNLYECQLSFPSHSHEDNITMNDLKVSDDFNFDIYYKFCTSEIEKYDFQIKTDSVIKYINNANITNLQGTYDGSPTNRGKVDNRPYDIKYTEGKDAYKIYTFGKDVDVSTKNMSELDKVIKNTKDFALTRFRQERDQLVNKTIENIRTNVGLRRIPSPINIYMEDPRSIPDYLEGQVRNFANSTVTNLLKVPNSALSAVAYDIDKERVGKGKAPINSGKYDKDVIADGLTRIDGY